MIFVLGLASPALVLLFGLVLHETGHAYAYRLLSGDRRPVRLVVSARGVAIRRPHLDSGVREALISCAGPLLPGAIGVFTMAAAWAGHSPLAATYGALLAAHLMCLAPFWSDGRKALRAYFVPVPSPIAACAAASLATGTRNGLHDT